MWLGSKRVKLHHSVGMEIGADCNTTLLRATQLQTPEFCAQTRV